MVAAAKAGLAREAVDARYPRVAEIPFDSERRRMSTIHRVPAGGGTRDAPGAPYVMYVKGAPDLLLEHCSRVRSGTATTPSSDEGRRAAAREVAALASQALRVIGVACRPLQSIPPDLSTGAVETDLTFLGLVGMRDPARPEAAPAVETARRAGMRVIMATGDNAQTAAAIGRTVGLLGAGETVLTGSEIDALDDDGLSAALGHVPVFARVTPRHKVRIVEALQRAGHVVGMTGDGVNDAPALKRADIGIAMGISGTDVDARDRRHGAHGRQLRLHHRGGGAGTDHLLQHPQVRLLPPHLQRRGDRHDLLRHRFRLARAAHGHPDPLDEPAHRRRAGPGPGDGEGGTGHHGSAAPAHGAAHHRPLHAAGARPAGNRDHRRHPAGLLDGTGMHPAR